MATTTFLNIDQPSEGHFIIKEVRSADEANAASVAIPGQVRFNAFQPKAAALLGDGCEDFSWPAGPIEIRGIVSAQTFGIGLELLFNDGDAGVRNIGVFWASLKEGLRIEYYGSTTARIDVNFKDGKYVHVDAERGQWSKKRVLLVLPDKPE